MALRSRTIMVIAVALAATLGATACGAIEEMAAQADCVDKYSDNVNLDEDATSDEILEAQESLMEDEEFLNCGKGGEADETDSVDPSAESAQAGTSADDPAEAVGPDAVAESLFAQMESILGPTDDIAAQVSPLLDVPVLPVLPGSHIVMFDSQVLRSFDESGTPDGTVGYSNTVGVKVDGELKAVAEQYSAQLASTGWAQIDSKEDETWDGSPQLVASYSSVDEGWMQLEVTDDLERGYLQANFWYRPEGLTQDPDGSLATRFAGWHGEVPIFEGTSWSSSNIGTHIDRDTGRTALSLYEFYRGGDVLSDEYVEDELLVLVDQAEAMGLTANYEVGNVYLSSGIFDSLEMSKGGGASIRLTGTRLIDAPPFESKAAEKADADAGDELIDCLVNKGFDADPDKIEADEIRAYHQALQECIRESLEGLNDLVEIEQRGAEAYQKCLVERGLDELPPAQTPEEVARQLELAGPCLEESEKIYQEYEDYES